MFGSGLLKGLAAEMMAPQKEIYVVTDLQERDWTERSGWFGDSLRDLSKDAAVYFVPVEGGSENLAITGLELISGVLRQGTSARYRATVRNCGMVAAESL